MMERMDMASNFALEAVGNGKEITNQMWVFWGPRAIESNHFTIERQSVVLKRQEMQNERVVFQRIFRCQNKIRRMSSVPKYDTLAICR